MIGQARRQAVRFSALQYTCAVLLTTLFFTMKFTTLTLASALAFTLIGCSKQEAPPPAAAPAAPAVATQSSYDQVASQGKGFTVGAMMSAQTVYVMFDPQCGHCGRLWQASLPLHNKVKFVWIPIAFNPSKSLPQGAALLSAANPVDTMNAHEQSLLAGTGGMSASADVPDDLKQAITANTALLGRLGVDSVPYVVAKHRQTGAIVSQNGALDTAALAAFLGLDPV